MTQRRLALAMLLLLCAGCRKREAVQARPPGLLDEEGKQRTETAPVAPPVVAPAAPEPTTYDFERPSAPDPGALSRPSAAAPPAVEPSATSDVDPAGARDLSAELSSALAVSSSCVDVEKAAAQPDGRLTISVSAYLLGSGHVSRASVTASGQPAAAISCLEKAALAIKLNDPIASAPIHVQASTQLQFKAVRGSAATPPAGAAPIIPPHRVSTDVARPSEPVDLAGPP